MIMFYWMVIDKWCHLKNLGLEGGRILINRKNYNKIYGTYLNNLFAHISDDQGIINQHKSTCICIA